MLQPLAPGSVITRSIVENVVSYGGGVSNGTSM